MVGRKRWPPPTDPQTNLQIISKKEPPLQKLTSEKGWMDGTINVSAQLEMLYVDVDCMPFFSNAIKIIKPQNKNKQAKKPQNSVDHARVQDIFTWN